MCLNAQTDILVTPSLGLFIYIKHLNTFTDSGLDMLKIISLFQDFPGSLLVKTLPSNAGSTGSVLGWEAKIPHMSQQKTKV